MGIETDVAELQAEVAQLRAIVSQVLDIPMFRKTVKGPNFDPILHEACRLNISVELFERFVKLGNQFHLLLGSRSKPDFSYVELVLEEIYSANYDAYGDTYGDMTCINDLFLQVLHYQLWSGHTNLDYDEVQSLKLLMDHIKGENTV